jgi:sugar lactone lactonase YvrE/DNA-binding IclR family transcriptional regulator
MPRIRPVSTLGIPATHMPEPQAAAPGLGVLEKAMGLLNIVSARRTPLTFTELLRASGLPKATLHRTLNTLVHEGLLRHDAYNKTFQLGFRLLELAHEVWSDFDLRVAAQDELLRLRDAVADSVQLVVLSGRQLIVVASEDAGREPAALSPVGRRLDLHSSAAGKAIVAHLGSTERLALQQGLAGDAAAALRSELDLTRARGYALDDVSAAATQTSVAAPVFDLEGRPVGAVAPAHRLDARRAHSLSATLIGAARAITHSAGGQTMSIAPRSPPEAAPAAAVRTVGTARALLGEGPMWSPRDHALYWVDILTPAVHRLDPADGSSSHTQLGAMVSMVVAKASGGLLAATPAGLMTLQPEDGALTLFAHPEAGRNGQRYNDGKCDRRGRLWISTMDMGAAPHRGSLYRVDPDGGCNKMDSGFTVPNGLGFSPDNKRMYFTDTFRKTVYEYDFDLAAGRISGRRPLIVFDPDDGKPDGLTVDNEGCIWVAVWDAWRVSRFSPTGEELMRIRLPVPRPTSCCFGGANLQTLYITSASVRLSEQALAAAPLSGALFALELPGVRGLPETTFAG